MPRMLVAYDPSWPEQFTAAAAQLRSHGDPDWDAVNQRILRDWLLENPADADRYRHAKCDAVAAAARGTSSYNAAKGPVIEEIVDRARAARGLPLIEVSDK